VTLGAAINQALPYLRLEAESMQTAQVRVDRLGPPGLPDPGTGKVSPTTSTIYSGPGRVKPLKRVTAGAVTAGEALDSESVFIVSLPNSALGVRAGDVVHVTAATDPELLTDTFRVVNIEDSEQTTARRLTCELVEARQS
jgi:uncharacterized protein DUF6093